AGQEDVVVGTPVAGRTHRELEGLIGFFVNMLALRGDLSGEPTAVELLGRVREAALGAYAHQELPFERLVEELAVERSLAHGPVFQAAFAVDRATGREERLSLGALEPEPFGRGGGIAKFELNLALTDDGEALHGALVYRAALFDAATIARMAGHLEVVLEAMAADPLRRLAEVSLLRGAERAQLLEAWNATAAELPRACLHELFAAQAARTPDAVAVAVADRDLTYAELDGRADALAGRLRALGVRPEVRVALSTVRDARYAVAVLGVLKAGGACVPLDPSYPAERLEYLLADSGAHVLLADPVTSGGLPPFAGATLLLDGDGTLLSGDGEHADPAAAVGASPDNLAYVIYTSGSTGRPKGVLTPHRAACNLVLSAVETFRMRPGRRHAQSASIGFDLTVLELFLSLFSGAELHPVDRETVAAPERLVELLREREIDTWIAVPALLDALGDAELPALHTLCVGGDRCSAETAARWGPGRRMMNMYGPTETTIYSTWHLVDPAVGAPPIGRPVWNTRAYLLDEQMRPVGPGIPGEVYLGGVGVARGYHGRPELTAERFVPDPLSNEPGARLYRTGDRGRLTAGLELEFLGRVDAQVKVRGYRIEPGEIEAALLAQEGVREAVVVAREDVPGQKRLVAYLVPEAGAELSTWELKARLGSRLPQYMVPAAFVLLERLPLNATGKLDREALPAQSAAERERDQPLVPPRDALELRLARVWEELLGVPAVGVRDRFVDLGGHSLLAVRLMARVEEIGGRRVPLAAFFSEPTVEHLARLLRAEAAMAPASPLVPLQPHGGGTPLFFVHPVGGSVLSYEALSRHLGATRPFYGLQSRGLDGEAVSAKTVEEMAEDYLGCVRGVQPRGPYLLGGWSMGGVVAFEMARRLRAEGEDVALLALLDSVLARDGAEAEDDDIEPYLHFALHLGLDPGQGNVTEAEARAMGHAERLEHIRRAAVAADLFPGDVAPARIESLFAVFRTNASALRRYVPGVYDGVVTLLRAAGSSGSVPSVWERVAAGGVRVREVPGTHFSMVREPGVRTLAGVLSEELRSADV
ncbi:MAG TPA: amino acid adenylation domain-containing protein, partial [Longimicrobiaceae bacterium]|nr:amino acid adenylation domain-containing protein [Longimicrobiaceae bacterium]